MKIITKNNKRGWLLTPPATSSNDALSVTVRALIRDRAEVRKQLCRARTNASPMTPEDVKEATERLASIRAELEKINNKILLH